MSTARTPYPSDVSDDEWALIAPYLALVNEQALQRKYDLREAYNGLRWLAPVSRRCAVADAAA